MDTVLAVLVAVAGWVVSQFFSLRAQRKNFENQILDRARMEIGRAVHEYQRWLSKLGIAISIASINVSMTETSSPRQKSPRDPSVASCGFLS